MIENLRSQFGTLKRGAHSKYPPMAFTEQGVAMLSSVLNSDRAVEKQIAKLRPAGCAASVRPKAAVGRFNETHPSGLFFKD
ncbi:MAG: ORF6N domain-containing protein [Desulfobacterales bacterium]|uniref:ORF6N domain-containing protein n=1 Tax=Candidatus Desulfatibia profunda TaxID=2841695 RepID=A0A8J6NUF4_9BACT|nr:ORF6N domain-containing protein [Candidatus Desulfatibia profunda]MBL7180112.1 ORF6N domain-containing protein [Desulfobacterales bacterium]